ncbi:MAG: hypothetical protein ACLP7O_07145 [Terracidiphilus sp.]
MDALQQQIEEIGKLLSEIGGSNFVAVNKPYGNRLPYRWEVRTKDEPIHYVTTIQLTARDILRLNDSREDEKREYLRRRFGHLFSSH